MENYIEKCKAIRKLTMAAMNKISAALTDAKGDIDQAVAILLQQKQADANDMANRTADTCIVYSYVHNNKVGAMIVLACQTDFVAKNEVFLNLAKDICMHIVSTTPAPEYLDKTCVPEDRLNDLKSVYLSHLQPGKPEAVKRKIIAGKLEKFFHDTCLLEQPFVKDDKKTIGQIIAEASATLGEKIEVKQFVKITAR